MPASLLASLDALMAFVRQHQTHGKLSQQEFQALTDLDVAFGATWLQNGNAEVPPPAAGACLACSKLPYRFVPGWNDFRIGASEPASYVIMNQVLWLNGMEARRRAVQEKEVPTAAVPSSQAAPAKKRRRRQAARRVIPLTGKEAEAVHLVGEHKGNISAAADAVGISRQAMKKRYDKAMKKLGKAALPKPKTESLPSDRRGQANVPATRNPPE